jgi:hypothetical protein
MSSRNNGVFAMNDQSEHDNKHKERNMNIEFDSLSVNTGHVVFAGRDSQINVHTGGDVEQHASQKVTVAGVETTNEARDKMIAAIREFDKAIEQASLDEDTTEAALEDLQRLEKQLTSSKKPNPRILVSAAKSLFRISPMLASGIIALFGEPLVAQIVAGVGGIAMKFYNVLMQKKSQK